MIGGGGKEPDGHEVKVAELKEELDARGESNKTGNKAWLRRRLHAVLVHAHLEAEAAGADPD